MCDYAKTCKEICSCNLVYNFLIQLFSLQNQVFVVHFHTHFGMETRHFQKVVLLLVIFPLSYSEYRNVKICFHFTVIKIKFFSLVSHSCRSCSICVALLSHPCCSCCTRVHLYRLCCTRVVRLDRFTEFSTRIEIVY